MGLFKVHWVEITLVCVKIIFFSIKTVISPNLPMQCESVCGWQGPQDLGLALILQNSCSGGGRWLMWPPLWQSCLPKIDRGGPEVYYCVYWIFYDKSLSGQDFQLWHAWEFVKIWGVFSPLLKDMNNMDCYIHFYRGPCSLLRPTLVWHK